MRKFSSYPLVCLLLALSVIQIGAGLPGHADPLPFFDGAPEGEEWVQQLQSGLTALNAHQYEQAENQLMAAYTRAKQQNPVGRETIISMTYLAQLACDRQQYPKAVAMGEQAVDLAEKHYRDELFPVFPLINLATIYLAQGIPDYAREVFARARAIATAHMADDGHTVLKAIIWLGSFCAERNHGETAAHCLSLACSLAEQNAAEYAVELKYARYLLITQYIEQGQYRAAEPIARIFLKAEDDIAGTRTDARFATPLLLLAQIENNLGNDRETMALYERLVTLFTALPGDNRITIAQLQVGLAACECNLGQYQHAKERVLPAQATLQAICKATDPRALAGLYVQAELADEAGDFQECARITTLVTEQAQHIFGMEDPGFITALMLRGAYEFNQGQYAKALVTAQQIKTIASTHDSPTHPDVMRINIDIANILGVIRQTDEAASLCAQSLPVLIEAYGSESRITAYAQCIMAKTLLAQKNWQQAEPLLQHALPTMRQSFGECHPTIARILSSQAEAKCQQQQYADARRLAEQALAMMEACLGPDNYQNADYLYDLGNITEAQGKLADAEGYYRRALAIRQKALPAGHPDTIATLQAYADLLDKLHRPEEATGLRNQAAAAKEKH